MTQNAPAEGWIVVIGLSAGGLPVLRRLVADLPAGFAAPVLVVQHIGAHPSQLARALDRCGSLPARFASHGEPLRPGQLYVAPPDCHLLVDAGALRLSHGPKVNHTRPAIDPTLRSCALAHGPRAIGVVLSGLLDDGTAGLQAVKECGGVAVVQDPGTAEAPEMPLSALDHVRIDHCAAPESLGPLLARLVQAALPVPAADAATRCQRLAREQRASEGVEGMAFICNDTDPTLLTCPDCAGTLWRVRESRPARFVCHTGHAYALGTLAHAQRGASEQVLRSAVRMLREHAVLMRELEAEERALGRKGQAWQAGHRAAAALDQSDALRALADRAPDGTQHAEPQWLQAGAGGASAGSPPVRPDAPSAPAGRVR